LTHFALVWFLARVCSPVRFQVLTSNESLLTEVTFVRLLALVWFLARMSASVCLQILTSNKTFLTEVTLVRPFACMDSGVNGQTTSLGKPLLAEVTLVRFLPSMNPHVYLQVLFSSDNFVTDLTFIIPMLHRRCISWLTYYCSVRRWTQGVGVGGNLPDIGTLCRGDNVPSWLNVWSRRSFTCMDSGVDFQTTGLRKPLLTEVTLVWFLPRVDAHVYLEVLSGCGHLVTHLAFVRFAASSLNCRARILGSRSRQTSPMVGINIRCYIYHLLLELQVRVEGR
jgi:hypothetical protein